jgi:hypothetical protein
VNTVAGTIAELELLGKQDAADRVRVGGELEESYGFDPSPLWDFAEGVGRAAEITGAAMARATARDFDEFTDNVSGIPADLADALSAVSRGEFSEARDELSDAAGGVARFNRDMFGLATPEPLRDRVGLGYNPADLVLNFDPEDPIGSVNAKSPDRQRSNGRADRFFRSV